MGIHMKINFLQTVESRISSSGTYTRSRSRIKVDTDSRARRKKVRVYYAVLKGRLINARNQITHRYRYSRNSVSIKTIWQRRLYKTSGTLIGYYRVKAFGRKQWGSKGNFNQNKNTK